MRKDIAVLVIDDSAYNRLALTGLLESIPGIKAVATAIDGVDGYRQALRTRPDLIILDLEMPNMDGFTFLRLIKGAGEIPVLVISGRSWKAHAPKAFELGAVDFIEKPTMAASDRLFSIRGELARKVKTIPFKREIGHDRAARPLSAEPGAPEAIVIGASTGGPKAVFSVIKALKRGLCASVAVALHMPPWLTEPFAKRLGSESEVEVSVARDGAEVKKGRVLMAPGGRHMTFEKNGGAVYARLAENTDGDPCAPSIDRMFKSAAGVWGPRLAGAVLTGMGDDGTRGALEIKRNGGRVMAESKESSVIFSMPDSAISSGSVDEVLTCVEIGGWIEKRCRPAQRGGRANPGALTAGQDG